MPKGKLDSLLGRSLKSSQQIVSNNTSLLTKEDKKTSRSKESGKKSSSILKKARILDEKGREIQTYEVDEEGQQFPEAPSKAGDFGTFSSSYRDCEFKDIDAEKQGERSSYLYNDIKGTSLKNIYYQSLEIAPPPLTIEVKQHSSGMKTNLLSQIDEVDDDYSLNHYENDNVYNDNDKQRSESYKKNRNSCSYFHRLYHYLFRRNRVSRVSLSDDYDQIVDISEDNDRLKDVEGRSSCTNRVLCYNCCKGCVDYDKAHFYDFSTYVKTVILIICISLERICFKATIDQMEPFRIFSAIFMSIFNTGLLYIIVKMKRTKSVNIIDIEASVESNNDFDGNTAFPRFDIFVIAMLDSIQLYLITITAGNTPPVLTVLLMQATKPLNYLLRTVGCNLFNSNVTQASQLQNNGQSITPNSRHDNFAKSAKGKENLEKKRTFSDYLKNNGQYLGSFLISIGIVASLFVSLFASIRSKEFLSVVNMSAYFFLCLFSCISSLYKERAILRYEYPISNFYISYLTGKYQVIIMLLLSPIAYSLQGLGMDDFTSYYKIKYLSALRDSFVCFSSINFNKNVNINTQFSFPYPEDSPCNYALPSALIYSLSLSFTPLLLELVFFNINREKAKLAAEQKEKEEFLARSISSKNILRTASTKSHNDYNKDSDPYYRYKSTDNLMINRYSLNNLIASNYVKNASEKPISVSSPPSARAILQFNSADSNAETSIFQNKMNENVHISPKEISESNRYIHKCILSGFIFSTGALAMYSYYRAGNPGWVYNVQLNGGDLIGFVLIVIGLDLYFRQNNEAQDSVQIMTPILPKKKVSPRKKGKRSKDNKNRSTSKNHSNESDLDTSNRSDASENN